MSLVTSGLGSNNLLTLGLGAQGQVDADLGDYISLKETTVLANIENIVTPIIKAVPLTGIYSLEQDIQGWQWDKKPIESAANQKSLYLTHLGGHKNGLKEGTVEAYWQSGVIRDIDYLQVSTQREGDDLTWTPVYSTGAYSVFWDQMPLYSNYSYTSKMEALESELTSIELEAEALESSIFVSIMMRDTNYVKRPYINFEQVEEFTGALETLSGEREATVDGEGKILPESLSSRHREFLIQESETNNKLILNGNYYKAVGQHPGELKEEYILQVLEPGGVGIGDSRLVYTKYFPLKSNSLSVIALRKDGYFEKVEQVSTLNFSNGSEAHCVVDEDLGIITIGGYKAPDLVLSEEIDEFETSISFFKESLKSQSYPSQGIIQIGSEKILYYLKASSGFAECIRGYAGTKPSTHSKFSIIEDLRHGKVYSSEYSFYLKYIAVPRIQYEVTDSNNRHANKSGFLDLRPVKNSTSNNIVQISTIEKHVASVEIVTDLSNIGGNLYGPLLYGTDFTQLCANVYDSYGNLVEGIETTILVNSNTGSLNGGTSTYTSKTNSAGQICSVYSVPYDSESISAQIKNIYYDGDDTVMEISERPPGTDSENVTIFQVLKHDPILGTVGKKFNCVVGSGVESESSTLPYNSFEIEGFVEWPSNNFENGFADILVASGSSVIKYRREILHTYRVYDSDGKVNGMKIILKENVPGISNPSALSYCWLFEKDAKEWNSSFLDGVNVLLYEWKEDILNPNTMEYGAYYPLRPDIVESKRLVFKNRKLPIPDPDDVEVNLGGYLAIIPDMVKVHAYASDPATGRLITSNSIRIKLDLPAYLKGVDKTNPALPIPYGFTFITEDFNIGSGIGGANFLTINPKAEGTSSYNLFITPDSRGH